MLDQDSRPSPTPAQHLLTLAQIYIDSGDTETAKTKLQEIIDNYPGDPAAAKAKQLQEKLNGQ